MNLAVQKFVSARNPVCVGLVLLLLGLILFHNTFDNEFCSDDRDIIVGNPAIRNLHDLPRIWRAFNTRSLTGLTFALNYRLHGLQRPGYQAVNLLIHIAVSFLVYLLAWTTIHTPRLTDSVLAPRAGPIAFLASLIFLLHPLQTQAVNFVSQRAVSLAVFFYLSGLILYVRSRSRPAAWFYPGALLAMLLGTFTKETIITLPLMLTAYEWYFFPQDKPAWHRTGFRLLPFYFLAVLVPVWLTFDRPDSLLQLKRQLFEGSFSPRYFWTEINVLRTYVRMLLLPLHQSHHYQYPVVDHPLQGSLIFSLVLLTALAAWAVRQSRTRPLLSFGVAWFFISVVPEALHVCFVNKGLLYDHWLYLAMAGYSLFLPAAAFYFFRDTKVMAAVFIPALVFLSLLSFQRNAVWDNCLVLWQDVVRKAPDDHLPHVNLGVALSRRGAHQEAIEQYQQALTLFRGRDRKALAQIFVNLGAAYGRQGDHAREIEYSRQALDWDPKNSQAHSNLCLAFTMTGQKQKALEYGRAAVKYDPYNADAYNNLGVLFAREGDMTTAADYFRKALGAHPQHAQARMNFNRAIGRPFSFDSDGRAGDEYLAYVNEGVDLSREGDYQKAIESYQRALDLYQGDDPQIEARILVNLGAAYGRQGDYAREIEYNLQALQSNPGHVQAYNNLILAYAMTGEKEKALEYGRTVMEIDPFNADGYNNLGVLFAREGDMKKAAEYFREALRVNPGHVRARENMNKILGRGPLLP